MPLSQVRRHLTIPNIVLLFFFISFFAALGASARAALQSTVLAAASFIAGLGVLVLITGAMKRAKFQIVIPNAVSVVFLVFVAVLVPSAMPGFSAVIAIAALSVLIAERLLAGKPLKWPPKV